MKNGKPVPVPMPLLEREPEEINAELADFLGVDPENIRITKLKLSEGKNVAYIRAVWPRVGVYGAETPEKR